MKTLEVAALLAFLVWSATDLRYRTAPGVEFLFVVALSLTLVEYPLRAGVLSLAVAPSLLPDWPKFLVYVPALYPPAWPVLAVGYGVRRMVFGRADMFALAGIACVYPWYTMALALVGMAVWGRWWIARKVASGPVPFIPGMMLGLWVYGVGRVVIGLMFG